MAKFKSKNSGLIVEAYRAPWDNYESGLNLRKGDWVVTHSFDSNLDDVEFEAYIGKYPYDKYVMSNLIFSRDFELIAFSLTGESMGALCSMTDFWINGIYGESNDFGENYDHDSANACEYGCGDMRFESKSPTPEVLFKYKITKEEYNRVCNLLYEELSFGECGWCV